MDGWDSSADGVLLCAVQFATVGGAQLVVLDLVREYAFRRRQYAG
jgi:hypothetical protein